MRRKTHLEGFTEDYSYEEITQMETDFLLDLYEAVKTLAESSTTVTLPKISAIVGVRPKELMDYLPYIIQMEKQLGIYEDGE